MGIDTQEDEISWQIRQLQSLLSEEDMRPPHIECYSSLLLWRPNPHWPDVRCIGVFLKIDDAFSYELIHEDDIKSWHLDADQEAALKATLAEQDDIFRLGQTTLAAHIERTPDEITGGDSIKQIMDSLWEDGCYPTHNAAAPTPILRTVSGESLPVIPSSEGE